MGKIVAVIPIKLNNRRLPNKNLRKFDNDRRLCSYVFETLKSIKQIDEIYVYCSKKQIIQYLPKYIKFLERDEKFDTDKATMNDILESFAKKVDADVYLMTHCTSPFIKNKSIEIGLDAILYKNYDSSFSATKLQEFLWYKNKPYNYKLDKIPRTQDLPELVAETSGFYAFKKSVIIKKHRRIGDNPFIVLVDKIEAVDIDELEDFELANLIVKGRNI